VYTYRLLTARKPSGQELSVLTKLYEREYAKFRQYPAKMKGWLGAGQPPVDPKANRAALAAGTVVASAIMNSDAFITRR
jgi:hypothetical protein